MRPWRKRSLPHRLRLARRRTNLGSLRGLPAVVVVVQPYDLFLHHACRLKMYCEGGRDVTEDHANHIAFGNEGFHEA